jgi:hypothetical protein
MSAALNSLPDSSVNHSGSIPELSLSIGSSLSTPAKYNNLRVPSASSATTAPSSVPLSTPSPPAVPLYTRRKGDNALSNHEEEGDLLNTPGERWGEGIDTPMTARTKRTRSSTSGTKGANLTLRDQEKVYYPSFSYLFALIPRHSISTTLRKKTSTSSSACTSSKNG